MAQSPTSYPPTLSQEQLSNLIFNIKDYQVTHGMLLKYGPDANSIYAVPVGVSLFPSLFPESLFEEAKELQVLYNRLYARVAEDEEWLLEVLEGSVCYSESMNTASSLLMGNVLVYSLIRDDEFAGTLWRIYQEVKREGYVQVCKNKRCLKRAPLLSSPSCQLDVLSQVLCLLVLLPACIDTAFLPVRLQLFRIHSLSSSAIGMRSYGTCSLLKGCFVMNCLCVGAAGSHSKQVVMCIRPFRNEYFRFHYSFLSLLSLFLLNARNANDPRSTCTTGPIRR
jgi:hypothetical protein